MKQTWKRMLSIMIMAVLWLSAASPAVALATGPATVSGGSVSEDAAPDKADAADNGLHSIKKGATYASGSAVRFYATGAGYGPESAQELRPLAGSTRYRPVSWSVGGKSGLWTRYSEKTAGRTQNGRYIPGEYRFNGSFQLTPQAFGGVPYTLQVRYQEEIYNGDSKSWGRTGRSDVKSVSFYIKNAKIKKNQSLSVRASSLALTEYGKSKSIKASNAVGKVTYISSNPKVAKVSAKGKVTPLLHGTAVITVKANGNSSYYAAQRSVRVKVARAKISKKSLALVLGEKKTLKVPKVAQKIRWSTSNRSVASVDQKGKITAKRQGAAVITAKVGKAEYKCRLKVKKYRSISHRYITMKEGQRSRFSSSLTKEGTVWESANPDVAGVSETGRVTAYSKGKCKIYATTRQARRYVFHVTVQAAPVYNPAPTNPNPVPTLPSAVWLSATGDKYHRIPNCGNMNPDRATQVSYAEAVQRGYQPCQNCF